MNYYYHVFPSTPYSRKSSLDIYVDLSTHITQINKYSRSGRNSNSSVICSLGKISLTFNICLALISSAPHESWASHKTDSSWVVSAKTGLYFQRAEGWVVWLAER